MLRRISLKFVMDLVLQTGPEIHCHSPDLDLHLRVHGPVRQINRHGHNHMVTFVAACLGKCDVIFHRNHPDIPLFADHIRNSVNIGSKWTDNPYPRYVIDVFYHVVNGGLTSIALQFFYNAFRRLDSGLDVLNGIILMHMLELVIQYLHSCFNHFEGSIVNKGYFLPAVYSLSVAFS